MLTKRIIACLDVKNGRTVKGVNFVDLKDAGDPIELSKKYSQEGIDELVFLDISATVENKNTAVDLAQEVATSIDIPFTIGGGIKTKSDVNRLLQAGADKIAINSAALNNPELINELSAAFGSQCIVIAIDAKLVNGEWWVFKNGGSKKTERKLFPWASECAERGAGEILFTSMDHDGTKGGFAVKAMSKLSAELPIPIIASGGAGKVAHFAEVFSAGKADAALAASIFHFGEIGIPNLKTQLLQKGIPIRVN